VGTEICFGPYQLDASNARVLRGGVPVALTPKAFDVLNHLASRPQRLVTKEELLSAIWPDVIVSDASIKVCIREIRKALDDSVKAPAYIETVHRRGYRFIAQIDGNGSVNGQAEANGAAKGKDRGKGSAEAVPPNHGPAAAPAAAADAPPSMPNTFVGRDQEVARLRECFDVARSGRRQCVFISGGPGTGKTALAESFIRRLTDAAGNAVGNGVAPLVLGGHCFEQFGAGEPYMPVWEAIGRLDGGGPPVLQALLARHAAAYTGGVDDAAPVSGQAPSPPSTTDPRGTSVRLLREMAEGFEALAADAPVVLLLEDVHWADFSTIDLLSALARRRSPARLLVVVTYRPAEIHSPDHPLRGVVQGLLTAGLCREITLDFLDEPAVAQFLAARFPEARLPEALTRRLHQRTDGHPLFLVHVVEDLVEQGVIVERDGGWCLAGSLDDSESQSEAAASGTGASGDDPTVWLAALDTQVPKTVRAMIELHLERLDRPTRQALEAAAVAGMEFSAAEVAGALGVDVLQAEQACDDLARCHRFLRACGIAEWPDGTASAEYRFVHELYHNVVYEQVPVARRVRLHQLLGLAIEAGWIGRAPEEAAGLAMHFEMARDWPRAVKYLRHAAHSAGRQYAHREAALYLGRALRALDRLPEAERAEHELDVLKHLGVNLQVTRGFAAHEVEAVHARAYALCRASGDVARTFPVLWGIWLFHKVRSDLWRAREMCDELLAMARTSGDATLLVQAHQAVCVTHLCLGVPDITREHMERSATVYDPARHAVNTITFGQDPGVATLAFGAVALWLLGRPEEALSASERSLDLARRLDQPSSLALAMHFAAMLHQVRGDAAATLHWADETIRLAAEEGFSFWLAGGLVLRGWAKVIGGGSTEDESADDGGIANIRRGLEAWIATGSLTYHTYYLGLLADALQHLGRADEAAAPLEEALVAAQSLPEGLYEAELHRLRGRNVLMVSGDLTHPDAHESFAKALSTARAQGARWFEWRAADDLAALLRREGQAGEADELLASTSNRAQAPAAPQTSPLAFAGVPAKV